MSINPEIKAPCFNPVSLNNAIFNPIAGQIDDQPRLIDPDSERLVSWDNRKKCYN